MSRPAAFSNASQSPIHSSSAAPPTLEGLKRAAEMAGYSTACAYSDSADLLKPSYDQWRRRRFMSFAPMAVAVLCCIFVLAVG